MALGTRKVSQTMHEDNMVAMEICVFKTGVQHAHTKACKTFESLQYTNCLNWFMVT